jgi:NAD(P)H-dependent FMN reductase
MKLAVIVGSLRTQSYNRTLAGVLINRLPTDIETVVVDLVDVPFMNQDLEQDLPESVKRVASQVAAADGVVVISPEYNRGIPAVTKNIIDWLSRESTGNALKGKPVAIGGISSGPIKTHVMQSQLRPVLAHTGAIVLAAPVLALTVGDNNMTAEGEVSEATDRHLDSFVDAVISHVRLYTEASA